MEIDIESLFVEAGESFTIYVCEQRFAVGCGHEYFKRFKGKENILSTDTAIKKLTAKVLSWTQKNVPNVADLVKKCFFAENVSSSTNIIDIIVALSKLFSVHEHQAAGPKVLDPIIIQEGAISSRYLSHLVALHKESILQPAIIILLKDNNFDRARELLAKCPNGINVKMIRNSGKCEIYKIVNGGADDIDGFLDSYALQCFSTCSRTPRKMLLNDEWAHHSLIRYYSPLMFKIRSNLLFDEKDFVRSDISILINNLRDIDANGEDERRLVLAFRCMASLFRVYCNDCGGQDLTEALALAKALDNPLLLAHTFRYANFFTENSLQERNDMLLQAKRIFEKHGVEDHALYCENNFLLNQFYTDHIDTMRFSDMQQEAVNNVPGLVGMSLILNNAGVAHLYSGQPDEAMSYFKKGLDYSRERIVQKLGLMTNIMIAKAYCMDNVEEKEIRLLLNSIFDSLGVTRLPFLSANYVMNILSIVMAQKPDLVPSLMVDYPILEVVQNALTSNQMGSGSLIMQMQTLASRYSSFDNMGFNSILLPQKRSHVVGIRSDFLQRRCLNPTIFNAWL